MHRSGYNAIANHPVVAFQEQYRAAMGNWLGQATIAVMASLKVVKSILVDPCKGPASSNGGPRKWSSRNRRRFPIDSQCIVRQRAAKPVAHFFRAGVRAGAWIDKHRSAARR